MARKPATSGGGDISRTALHTLSPIPQRRILNKKKKTPKLQKYGSPKKKTKKRKKIVTCIKVALLSAGYSYRNPRWRESPRFHLGFAWRPPHPHPRSRSSESFVHVRRESRDAAPKREDDVIDGGVSLKTLSTTPMIKSWRTRRWGVSAICGLLRLKPLRSWEWATNDRNAIAKKRTKQTKKPNKQISMTTTSTSMNHEKKSSFKENCYEQRTTMTR